MQTDPRLDRSPTDTSPTDTSPNGHFPERTIPKPDTSSMDISLTGHNPTKTFARPDISPTGCFSENMCQSANCLVGRLSYNLEEMDICQYSIEITAATLNKRIAGINLYEYIIAERITQIMDNCKFSQENRYSTLQNMDDCHSLRDKDRYITSRDGGYNQSGQINRLPITLKKIKCLRLVFQSS